MFGYVKISKGELKIKEYDTYKAVYCSLCKRLGKNYGFLSRLTLSYDFTFLALLNMSLKEKCEGYKLGRCAFNPIKKCNYCIDTDFLEMPSAAAIIMLYYKILDNISDEKGLKKLGFMLIKPIYKRAYNKAKKSYPEISEIISEYIRAQYELEKSKCLSIDEICDPTAKALSEILAFCSDDANQKRILERLGYCLGKYIYLMDAFCDFPQDKQNGNYNIINLLDGEDSFDRIEKQIYYCINEAAKAFELLSVKRYKTILGNIIYLGLEDTYLKEKNNEKSV
ncbi:MAG: DUF5685 family protein [Clostridia bacterium]|nr:DUF5685 family protein [Clostridia bacterium]